MWVLILFLSTTGGTGQHIDMSSQKTCEQAAKVLLRQSASPNIYGNANYLQSVNAAVCVPK